MSSQVEHSSKPEPFKCTLAPRHKDIAKLVNVLGLICIQYKCFQIAIGYWPKSTYRSAAGQGQAQEPYDESLDPASRFLVAAGDIPITEQLNIG